MAFTRIGESDRVFRNYCTLRGWAIAFAIIQIAYDGCHVALGMILLTGGIMSWNGECHSPGLVFLIIVVALPVTLSKLFMVKLAYSIFSGITQDESPEITSSSFKSFVTFKFCLVVVLLSVLGFVAVDGSVKLFDPLVFGYMAIDTGIFTACAAIIGLYLKSAQMNGRQATGLSGFDENCNVDFENKIEPVAV